MCDKYKKIYPLPPQEIVMDLLLDDASAVCVVFTTSGAAPVKLTVFNISVFFIIKTRIRIEYIL